MEIIHKRIWVTEKSTTGEYLIDGIAKPIYVLEDKDRGLTNDMTLEEINKIKVFGETAIPYGRYKIIISRSVRFSALASKAAGHLVDVFLPEILGTKGFAGARIHSGNRPEDTEGCQLPGLIKLTDSVAQSRDAMSIIFPKIQEALSSGKEVYINIIKSY